MQTAPENTKIKNYNVSKATTDKNTVNGTRRLA